MKNRNRFLDADLLHSDRLRRLAPAWVKKLVKRRIPYADFRGNQLRREAEGRFGGPIPLASDYDSPYDVRLGIFFDRGYTFAHNVAACRDLRVPFTVIDLAADDWQRRVAESGCGAFLATPDTLRHAWRLLHEERLWTLTRELGKVVCPTFEELFLWESKRRMRDWLMAHDVPHPETRVFFEREAALDFCSESTYPLVCKTDRGAASVGIFVLRDAAAAARLVERAFSDGLLARETDARERESGSILFQEHVPHDYEWRVVRVGDSFLCRRKVRAGDYASGSGEIGWAEPLPGMLEFVRKVTDTGGFRSMSVDLFENTTGRGESPFLVNELQALIGAIKKPNAPDEWAGRWLREPGGEWRFEPGFFYDNACANLRVEMLLADLGVHR